MFSRLYLVCGTWMQAEGQECFCWALIKCPNRRSFFYLLVSGFQGQCLALSIFFKSCRFLNAGEIHVCIFFPKMMKVTKTKDIAPFISISSILKVPLFPNLTLPFFTVLGQRGRLDREDPLIMEYWNRVLLLPVRWWGVNCEKPLQTELREH